MSTVYWICAVFLALATVLAVVRMMRGPSLLDRMLAADVVLGVVGAALLLHAVVTGSLVNLVFVLVVAVVGFLGSVSVARVVAAREQG